MTSSTQKNKKKFNKVNIEISNICNLQCSFCPEVIRAKQIMPLDLFRRIIQQVAPLTEQVCFHLMGEPLLNPHLRQMVDICHEYSVRIFLVSNGVLLKQKQSEILMHPAFRQVNFSLHSFNDNFPDRDPGEYLAKIFEYTECAFSLRPDLYINYRLWNLQDPRGASQSNTEVLKKISDYFSVKIDTSIDVRSRRSLHLKNRLYLHFDTEFIWPSLDLPILGEVGTCYGLSSHIGILADGTVVPCCLDKEGVISLGKIQDAPLLDILASPRAKELLEGFRRKKLSESLCQRCQYIERFKEASVNI